MSDDTLNKKIELLEILAEGCPTHPADRARRSATVTVPNALWSGLPDNSLKNLMMTNRQLATKVPESPIPNLSKQFLPIGIFTDEVLLGKGLTKWCEIKL